MTDHAIDNSPLVQARTAGVLYLVIIVCGIFSEVFVRGAVNVPGDAAATAQNILAERAWFRLGFVGDSLVFLSDVALAILLYVLLRPVSNVLAMIMAALRLTQSAILGYNLLGHHAALALLEGDHSAGFDAAQLNELALMQLTLQGDGYDLALIFFGVSCLLLGYLLVKSPLFPAILGWLAAAAGITYLIGSYTLFIFPAFSSAIEPIYVVALVGELAFCLWLLIKGVRSTA